MTQPLWQLDDGVEYGACVVVYRVSEEFGALSNMASGFPLRVNGLTIYSSEALYQACRFPHRPDWQEEIIRQRSPMAAKMKSKKDGRREHQSRPNWGEMQMDVMRWVLQVKLAQHFDRLAPMLARTGNSAIVEKSRRDRFWGAVAENDGVLRGRNHLGRLWMELRAKLAVTRPADMAIVEPLAVSDFLLLGQPVQSAGPGHKT